MRWSHTPGEYNFPSPIAENTPEPQADWGKGLASHDQNKIHSDIVLKMVNIQYSSRSGIVGHDWEVGVWGLSNRLPRISLLHYSLLANYVISPCFAFPSSSVEEDQKKKSLHGCLSIEYEITPSEYMVLNWISN